MAILAQCPICHRKQSNKNKVCSCGEDLDKAKRSKRVKYWINYRIPGGKQRREAVGFSIEEARDADGKRRSQKRENRIFDMLPEAKMTFSELSEWYLDLKTVKKLASHDRVQLALSNFNKVFGHLVVSNLRLMDIEDYQQKRDEDGLAPATIDMEVSIAKTMVTKAFDNDMVGGRTVKAFRKVKRQLRKGSNARKRTMSVAEYLKLIRGKWKDKRGKIKDVSPLHLKAILIMAYNTGMRTGELRQLQWSHIDRKKGFIRLPADITKERKPKNVPINHNVREMLNNLPRSLHHDYVFTYRGEPIKDRGGLRRSFKTACEKSGIPCGRKVPDGITFHDIRRTVKTNMMNAGVEKVLRDTILGHSLEGMDAYYMAPSEDDLHSAMQKYTEWLDSQLANVDQSVDQKEKEG